MRNGVSLSVRAAVLSQGQAVATGQFNGRGQCDRWEAGGTFTEPGACSRDGEKQLEQGLGMGTSISPLLPLALRLINYVLSALVCARPFPKIVSFPSQITPLG